MFGHFSFLLVILGLFYADNNTNAHEDGYTRMIYADFFLFFENYLEQMLYLNVRYSYIW